MFHSRNGVPFYLTVQSCYRHFGLRYAFIRPLMSDYSFVLLKKYMYWFSFPPETVLLQTFFFPFFIAYLKGQTWLYYQWSGTFVSGSGTVSIVTLCRPIISAVISGYPECLDPAISWPDWMQSFDGIYVYTAHCSLTHSVGWCLFILLSSDMLQVCNGRWCN